MVNPSTVIDLFPTLKVSIENDWYIEGTRRRHFKEYSAAAVELLKNCLGTSRARPALDTFAGRIWKVSNKSNNRRDIAGGRLYDIGKMGEGQRRLCIVNSPWLPYIVTLLQTYREDYECYVIACTATSACKISLHVFLDSVYVCTRNEYFAIHLRPKHDAPAYFSMFQPASLRSVSLFSLFGLAYSLDILRVLHS